MYTLYSKAKAQTHGAGMETVLASKVRCGQPCNQRCGIYGLCTWRMLGRSAGIPGLEPASEVSLISDN